MHIYAAYLDPASLERDGGLRMVKEGMCWPAFFFSFVWAAWHRLWGTALALLAAAGALLAAAAATADGILAPVAALALASFVGGEANGWRCRALERSGRRLAALVAGRNAEEAARRFFENADSAAARRAGAREGPPP